MTDPAAEVRDEATGVVDLAAPITNRYGIADDAAIFHGLHGQGVHHTGGKLVLYVAEQALADFIHTVAHELGHKPGGLAGSAEIDNLMCDDGGKKSGLRFRSLKLYYKPAARQSQWRAFSRVKPNRGKTP